MLIQHGDLQEQYQHLLGRKVKLSENDILLLKKSARLLQKLESSLSIFKHDHKIFKGKFLFAGKDQYIEIARMQQAIQSTLRNSVQEDNLESEDSRVLLLESEQEASFRKNEDRHEISRHDNMDTIMKEEAPFEEVKTPQGPSKELQAYLEYNKLVEEDFPLVCHRRSETQKPLSDCISKEEAHNGSATG